jgi:hypothetical protein
MQKRNLKYAEAFPWDSAPIYFVRGNDGAYGQVFLNRVRAMSIRDRPISPRSPWQNPYVGMRHYDVQRSGAIVIAPVLFGLHHRYARIWFSGRSRGLAHVQSCPRLENSVLRGHRAQQVRPRQPCRARGQCQDLAITRRHSKRKAIIGSSFAAR